MRNLTPAEVAAKWAQNAGAATQYWVNGVQAVQVSPGQAAAANQAGYLAGVQANVQKWATKLSQMTTASWVAETVAKGQPRYGQGITNATPKYLSAITKVLAVERTIVGNLPPRGTLAQNIQRSVAFQQAMAAAAEQGQFA